MGRTPLHLLTVLTIVRKKEKKNPELQLMTIMKPIPEKRVPRIQIPRMDQIVKKKHQRKKPNILQENRRGQKGIGEKKSRFRKR